MSPRSIRRAQEHKARKLARKAEKAMTMPVAAGGADVSSAPGVQSTSASAPDAHVRPLSPAQPRSEPRPQEAVSSKVSTAPAISPAQLAANRADSQHSTGAKTAAGKETVSFNAFRHGLAGRFVILPHENECEFKELGR
jgi:hypothetical protein